MCEGRTTGKTRQPATPVWEKVKVRRLISHCNEMGRRRLLSRFLLCLSWVTVQSVMYELKSEEAQLGPSILTQPPDSILWKHNGNKVVEFTGSEESMYGSYEGRIILNWHTAQLTISDLRLEDSGTYEYEIFTRGEMLISSYELEVIEKVAKPAITCEINNSSSSSLSAVLLCSVDQPRSPLMFEWSSDSSVQSGETLTIFLGGELDERQYTCQVSNPVSQETATFTAKDCNPDTGLSSGMVAVIVLIILMVCVGLLMLLYMLKRKDLACFKKGQPRDFENPPPSKGPHKKSAEENRTRAIDREATLPSSRPLAPCQDLHEEPCRDEEKKSLLTGTVREKIKKFEQRNSEQIFNTLTPKKTGLEQDKVAQDGNVVEEVEASSGMNNLNKEENSGHCKQNDENTQPSATTKQIISEPTDYGKDSNLPLAEATTSADNSAGEESAPLTQSTANLTAQDADGGHDKKLNAETQQPTMNEHRGSDKLEGGKEQKLPQGNSDNSEGDQHKTDGEKSASEDEATQSVHVVEDEKAASNLDNHREKEELDESSQNDDTQLPTTTKQLDSEVSEDVKDPNLSEAEPAKMEHSQQKIGNEDSPDETEAKKNDHVLEEAEASSDLDSASEKDKLGDSNQNDGTDTQLPTTTEQLDSETSVGVKDPNLSEAEAAKMEHSQQKIGNEDSPDETEAKKNDHVLEKAKASSDLDSPSEKDKLGYSNQNDGKDTQLPTTTEKIGSATSESGKGPNLSRAEPAKMEHSQQKIGNEDSLDETEPKTNDHVLEKAKASSDLDSPSEKDKLGDSNQNDDKHTATSTER